MEMEKLAKTTESGVGGRASLSVVLANFSISIYEN